MWLLKEAEAMLSMLILIADRVNARAMNLVDSSEEAAASIGLVKDITVSVEQSLKQIIED